MLVLSDTYLHVYYILDKSRRYLAEILPVGVKHYSVNQLIILDNI